MHTHRHNPIVGLAVILAIALAGCIPTATPLPPTSTNTPAPATNTAPPPTGTTQPPTDTAVAPSATPAPATNTAPSPTAPASSTATVAACVPTDQDQFVYNPGRLTVKAACLRVTGVIAVIRTEADGDLHILLQLDPEFANLLTPANQGEELGDLVIEPVCVKSVTQADAIATCAADHDPLAGPLPTMGQHVWMEGRYVLDTQHGSWAELHPLYRWGLEGAPAVNTFAPTPTLAPLFTPTGPSAATQPPAATQVAPTATEAATLAPADTATTEAQPTNTQGARVRVGALCNDGTSSNATGSGACSHHGGVKCWKYSDGTCTKP